MKKTISFRYVKTKSLNFQYYRYKLHILLVYFLFQHVKLYVNHIYAFKHINQRFYKILRKNYKIKSFYKF